MKIYTRTGDLGETGLFGGPRVPKDHPRIEAYGTVDELNATLGLARAVADIPDLDSLLQRIQSELFEVGAELATPKPSAHGTAMMGPRQIDFLEQSIDTLESELEPLRQFILPAGTSMAATLHVARTICRRAEREVLRLMHSSPDPVRVEPLQYLNRLSDLLFVMARFANHRAGRYDTPWQTHA